MSLKIIVSSLEDSAARFCFNEIILLDCLTNKTSHHKNCNTTYPTKTKNMKLVRLDTLKNYLVNTCKKPFKSLDSVPVTLISFT